MTRLNGLWASRCSTCFRCREKSGFRESFAYAGEAVDRGYSVLVFPEGRHTTDGEMLALPRWHRTVGKQSPNCYRAYAH